MGRTMWVNERISETIVGTSQFASNLLSSVEPNVLERATVVGVRGSISVNLGDPTDVVAYEMGFGLVVGPSVGFASVPRLLLASERFSWMWTGHVWLETTVLNTAIQRHYFELNVKSARRLRSGESTLYYCRDYIETGAGVVSMHGWFRTLLYIP